MLAKLWTGHAVRSTWIELGKVKRSNVFVELTAGKGREGTEQLGRSWRWRWGSTSETSDDKSCSVTSLLLEQDSTHGGGGGSAVQAGQIHGGGGGGAGQAKPKQGVG